MQAGGAGGGGRRRACTCRAAHPAAPAALLPLVPPPTQRQRTHVVHDLHGVPDGQPQHVQPGPQRVQPRHVRLRQARPARAAGGRGGARRGMHAACSRSAPAPGSRCFSPHPPIGTAAGTAGTAPSHCCGLCLHPPALRPSFLAPHRWPQPQQGRQPRTRAGCSRRRRPGGRAVGQGMQPYDALVLSPAARRAPACPHCTQHPTLAHHPHHPSCLLNDCVSAVQIPRQPPLAVRRCQLCGQGALCAEDEWSGRGARPGWGDVYSTREHVI